MHNSPFLYTLDCGSRKNMCNTDVNAIDTAIKTASINAEPTVPVQRMHLKVIILHNASPDQMTEYYF